MPGDLGLQGSCEEAFEEMGQKHVWDGDCPPGGSWDEAGEVCEGCPHRGLVFRVGAGAW